MTRPTSLLLLPVPVALISFALSSAAPAPVYRGPPKSITNSIGMKLVLIPPGKFMMGSPKNEEGGAQEGPEHETKITKAFYMGMFEVTQGEYEEVMGSSPSYFSARGKGKDEVKNLKTGRFPVESVDYAEAVKFCEKLSSRENNRPYRLPTEAEWEYACRGGAGSKTPFHFGKTLSSEQANFDGGCPDGGAAKGRELGRACEVGSYKPNGFGLYDMHGNVFEWCSDWSGVDYYANSPLEDPLGPKAGASRVIRGGSWNCGGVTCRSGFRGWYPPATRNNFIGFRVAMVPSE